MPLWYELVLAHVTAPVGYLRLHGRNYKEWGFRLTTAMTATTIFTNRKKLLGIRTVSLGSLEFKGFSVGKVWNDSAIRNGIPPSRHSM